METAQIQANGYWIALDRRGTVQARILETPQQTAKLIASTAFPKCSDDIRLVPWHHADWWQRKEAQKAPLITPEMIKPAPVAWGGPEVFKPKPVAKPKAARRPPIQYVARKLAKHFAKVGGARL